MGIKTYFQNRILLKEEKLNKRIKQLKNLKDIGSVLVLASVKTDEDILQWKRYFENLASHIKKVNMVFFVDDKGNKNHQLINESPLLIYPNSINWLGNLKNNDIIQNYIDIEYDLLIDLNFDEVFVLNAIFVKSKASLKVCSEMKVEQHKYSDLMIKTASAESKQKLYVDQVFYYLRQINSNGKN